MVFSKGKQLSSKAFVDLVTTRTRASLGAWKLSGGGGGVGTASIAESQGERARVGLGLGGVVLRCTGETRSQAFSGAFLEFREGCDPGPRLWLG